MKKIILSLILLPFLLYSYSYDIDDWYGIVKPDRFISITEDSFNAYFLCDNGIFIYDFLDDVFFYDFELSKGLKNENKYFLYYHPNVDYFFVITSHYILYRSGVGGHWNKKYLYELDIPSGSTIDNLGGSENYVIIEFNNQKIILNAFSLMPNDDVLFDDFNDITWSNSFYGISNIDIDLSQYYTYDNTIISDISIIDRSNMISYLTTVMLDRQDNLWIGTNTGQLFRGNDFSYLLERFDMAPLIDVPSGIYLDNQNNWYFYDKYFRRTGYDNYSNKDGYFLSIWNEDTNIWRHFPKNESIITNNLIVNDIYRIKDFLLVLTLDGLIIYDLMNDIWYKPNSFLDNRQIALWKVVEYKNILIFSTGDGLYICDYRNLEGKLVINPLEVISKGLSIYDVSVNENGIIFFSSSSGLFSYNKILKQTELIHSDIYFNLLYDEKRLFVASNDLWEINGKSRTFFSNDVKQFNYSDEKVCASDYKNVKIINVIFDDENELDIGALSIDYPIYSIDCNKDWLWFSNPEGLYFFKWSNYEK